MKQRLFLLIVVLAAAMSLQGCWYVVGRALVNKAHAAAAERQGVAYVSPAERAAQRCAAKTREGKRKGYTGTALKVYAAPSCRGAHD